MKHHIQTAWKGTTYICTCLTQHLFFHNIITHQQKQNSSSHYDNWTDLMLEYDTCGGRVAELGIGSKETMTQGGKREAVTSVCCISTFQLVATKHFPLLREVSSTPFNIWTFIFNKTNKKPSKFEGCLNSSCNLRTHPCIGSVKHAMHPWPDEGSNSASATQEAYFCSQWWQAVKIKFQFRY